MASPIQNRWTLKKILQNTYLQPGFRNRYDYKERDVIKRITIKEVKQYNISLNQVRTTFQIESSSYPQYYPYTTTKNLQNRRRQRTYRHDYEVIIQLDRLSINVPFKARVGTSRKWDFSAAGKTKKSRTGRIIEGSNYKRGLNGDFWFRCSWVWQKEGILFGRNYANGAPKIVNKNNIVFAPKHFINVVEQLMNREILRDD